MAATYDEVINARDIEELPRVMDGNILRQEIYQSASLATKLTITYDDAGRTVRRDLEDI